MDPSNYNLTLPDSTPEDNNRSFYDCSETNCSILYSDSNLEMFQKLPITLYSIIFILGIIGNGLVIWIAGFRMKKTISAVWFLHLAIADLLCCASLPLRIAEWVNTHPASTSSDIFCISSIILFNLNMSASVLLLTAMSIDRWVSVMWPFWAKVHRTSEIAKISAGMIWGMSLILTGLVFFLYGFYLHDIGEWCVDANYYTVHIYKTKLIIRLIRLVIMFAIPFFIIFTSYVTIYITLRNSKRPPRSQRPYRIITAVVLCFFVCWAPYYIWPLTPMYDEDDDVRFFTVNIIIISLACLNSCINPIIYVFLGEDFKHGFLRSIPSRLERALMDQPNDVCGEREDCKHTHTLDV